MVEPPLDIPIFETEADGNLREQDALPDELPDEFPEDISFDGGGEISDESGLHSDALHAQLREEPTSGPTSDQTQVGAEEDQSSLFMTDADVSDAMSWDISFAQGGDEEASEKSGLQSDAFQDQLDETPAEPSPPQDYAHDDQSSLFLTQTDVSDAMSWDISFDQGGSDESSAEIDMPSDASFQDQPDETPVEPQPVAYAQEDQSALFPSDTDLSDAMSWDISFDDHRGDEESSAETAIPSDTVHKSALQAFADEESPPTPDTVKKKSKEEEDDDESSLFSTKMVSLDDISDDELFGSVK